MVPLIQIAPSGLTAPSDSSTINPDTAGSAAKPFELSMARALAKNPEATEQQFPPREALQQSVRGGDGSSPGPDQPFPAKAALRRPPRDGTPARPASNPEDPPSQVSSPRAIQARQDPKDGSVAHDEGPSDRSSSSAPAISGAAVMTASDPSLVHALAATVPAIVVPTPELAPLSRRVGDSKSQSSAASCVLESFSERPGADGSPVTAKAGTGETNAKPEKTTLSAHAAPRGDSARPIPSAEQGAASARPGSTPPPSLTGKDPTDGKTPESNGAELNQSAPPAPDGPAPPDLPGLACALGAAPPGNAAAAKAKSVSTFTDGPPPTDPGNECPQALGTSAAQQELSMKNGQKVQQSAALSEKNLPGDGAVAAGQAAQTRSADLSADLGKIAAEANAGGVDGLNGPTASAPADVPVSSIDDSRLNELERTHELVSMHALRLSQSGNDSLRVVIEPGAGTSLSLELRFNNGAIEAHALLRQGDFEFLSGHWAELQQRLEPRGVHLAALESPTHSATDQRQSQQPGRQPADEPPTRSAFAEFAFDGSMEDSPAARRGRLKTYAGWETWA